MKVAFLYDLVNLDGTGRGGAEMTAAEFRDAAPDGIETIYVAHDEIEKAQDCDKAVVLNCVKYPAETMHILAHMPVVRYWNDVAPHGSLELTQWLTENAMNVFCSPLHVERFPWRSDKMVDVATIPPPVDLAPFRKAAEQSNGSRSGAVSIAQWRGWGKNPRLAQEWAAENEPVDFYGGGNAAPPRSFPVPYGDLPRLLSRYETFVYLPGQLEPFCRTVAEAWAAGCRIVVNKLVGATYWIRENPGAIDTAAENFWQLVVER